MPFFGGLGLSSLRVKLYIALSTVNNHPYPRVPLSTADSQDNTAINRDRGVTAIIVAIFSDQLAVLFLHVVRTVRVPVPSTNSQRGDPSSSSKVQPFIIVSSRLFRVYLLSLWLGITLFLNINYGG